MGLVALAACGFALGARESGALAPLEHEALKARFSVRGTEPVDGLLVVGIDATSFYADEWAQMKAHTTIGAAILPALQGRRPLPEVIRELAGLRGTHLDPALVDAFLPLAPDLHAECFADDPVAGPAETAEPHTGIAAV